MIPAVTLLAGRETILRDEHLRRIRTALFKNPSAAQLDQHWFDASRQTLMEILAAAQTPPFSAPKRLVVIDGVEAFKDADRKMLLPALKNPSPHAVWVLITAEKNIRRGFLGQVAAVAKVHSCETPYREAEIRDWLRKQFGRWGKTADFKAVAVILELIGKDLTQLAAAAEQLAVFTGERKAVTVGDAEALLGESAERNVFDLYDALKGGRPEVAWKILRRLKTQGKRAHEVFGSLAWQFDRMLRVRNLLDQGMGPADVSRELGMPGFFAEQAVRRAKGMNAGKLKKDLGLLIGCDRDIKRGRVREDLALERCVLALSEV